jgi:carbon monoxide dehydrogenase subunit G
VAADAGGDRRRSSLGEGFATRVYGNRRGHRVVDQVTGIDPHLPVTPSRRPGSPASPTGTGSIGISLALPGATSRSRRTRLPRMATTRTPAGSRLAPVRLENAFEVPASPALAWALLNDVPRVVPCLPGAELTGVVGENAWSATLHVKLGPIALQFLSDVRRVRQDQAAGIVQLEVKAREAKGRGGATATIESRLVEVGPKTRVSLVTELALQGQVAQYGRGLMGSVAEQLTSQFAECLSHLLGTSTAARTPTTVNQRVRPVSGLSLTLRAIGSWLTRPFRRR